MNIGETYYCSRCLREIAESRTCPYCGFEPDTLMPEFCLEEGTLFQNGRYELGTVIGQGGFGITYAAWDLILDIPVAIKEYFPIEYCRRDITESDEVEIINNYFYVGLQSFIRESRVLASLQNINTVVRVYDSFEKNNTAYIIMEYVRGETLLSYSEKKKMNGKGLLTLLQPLIDDLILIHKSGVLHRDISPNNILIQEDGTPKLIDFGAAMTISKDSLQNPSFNMSFAAPEQYAADGRQGFWTDVYGLSATIYTVMTGKIMQDAQSRFNCDNVKMPVYADKYSKRIMNGIRHGLILDTKKRTQNMEELRADLYHLPKPIVTKRQKIEAVIKAILVFVLVDIAYYGIVTCVDEKWISQFLDAVQCYTQADTEYAIKLADNYLEGRSGEFGYRENIDKSLYWYKWAADKGNRDAMFQYALILQEGKITEQDIPTAKAYYEKAACPELPESWLNLGYISNNVENDARTAMHYYEKAAEYDVGLAFTNLALIYENGEIVEKDVDRSVEYLKKAAQLQEPYAMYRLSCCYNFGIGVAQNDIECLRLLFESAERGCQEAMCTLGTIYETGEFELIDYDMAIYWYEAAIEQDNNNGIGFYYEGLFYKKGGEDNLVDELDKRTASADMELAARKGYEPAYEEVLQMAMDGYGIFADEEKAAEIINTYGGK